MAQITRTSETSNRLLIGLNVVLLALVFNSCQSFSETTVKTKSAANEAVVIGALRTISAAQTAYSISHEGEYGTFEELVKAGNLDARFSGARPITGGYELTIKVAPKDSSGTGATYAINADPEKNVAAGSTGSRHFFMDSTNVIRVNPKQPAGASDPQL